MPTKDPHIALIDAHEKLHQLRMTTRKAVLLLQEKVKQGYKLTENDKQELAIFKQKVIDAARRIQDELAEEFEGHGFNIDG